MSYVFNNINSLLQDDEKKDPNAATNIFAPEESQMGNQQAGGQMPNDGSQVKTTSEAEVGGNGSSSGQQAAEAKPAEGPQAADSRLMRKNKVKGAPQFAKRAEGDLATAQQNLQTEADSYLAGQEKDYTVSPDNAEKAISGDKDQQAAINRLMTGTADRAEQFAPKTDYTVEDIDNMQTDAGLDQILRRESGPEYSAGEAAFDRSLLNRSGEFNQLRSLLKNNQGNLTRQADEWSGAEGEKTKAAQKALEDNFAAAKTGVTGYLGGQGDTLRKTQETDAVAENAARKALREGKDPKFATDQEQKAIAKLIADYQGTDPAGVLKYIKAGLVDPKLYAKVAGDVTWEQGIDDKEAQRFNSIMGLLGKTDAWQAGSGFGDRQTFDTKGYTSAAESAAKGKNLAADKEAQALIDRLMSALDERKANEIAYRDQMKLTPNRMGASDAMLVEQIRKSLGSEYGSDALNSILSKVNAGDYLHYNDVNADSRAWLDKGEAEAMNKALAELGVPYKPVTVGSGAGPRSTFDKQGYESALRSLILASKAGASAGAPARTMSPTATDAAKRPISDFEKAKKAKVDVKDPAGRTIKKPKI